MDELSKEDREYLQKMGALANKINAIFRDEEVPLELALMSMNIVGIYSYAVLGKTYEEFFLDNVSRILDQKSFYIDASIRKIKEENEKRDG